MRTHSEIIKELGGAIPLSKQLGESYQRVQHWEMKVIPGSHFLRVIQVARKLKVKLSLMELARGAE